MREGERESKEDGRSWRLIFVIGLRHRCAAHIILHAT